jgi:Fe-S oxidoreductase
MGKAKADQIRKTGAKFVVAPCANCKKQLKEVCEDNDLGDVEIVGLHDLLLKVIDFGTDARADDEDTGEAQAESASIAERNEA